MDRGAWQATVHGVATSWTQLKQLSTAQHSFKKAAMLYKLQAQDTWIYPAFFPNVFCMPGSFFTYSCIGLKWKCTLILSLISSFSPFKHFLLQLTVSEAVVHLLSPPHTSSCQSPCPGSLSSYSQPDWHLRPGWSGVNNACLLVLRLPECAP